MTAMEARSSQSLRRPTVGTVLRESTRRAGKVVVSVAFAFVFVGSLAGCDPLNLDGFFYDPLKAPPGGYPELPHTVIPEEMHIHVPSEGQSLDGVVIPSSGRRPDITLIYFHGQNSNLYTTWPRLEYLYPLGYNLVMVDPRGYGASTGTPTEAGLQADERAILLWVQDHLIGNPNGLVFYGRSLGSGLAINLAYQKRAGFDVSPTPAVLITESAFASVASFVNDATYVELPSSFVSESSWDNLTKIKSVHGALPPVSRDSRRLRRPSLFRRARRRPPRRRTSSIAWKGPTTATCPRRWGSTPTARPSKLSSSRPSRRPRRRRDALKAASERLQVDAEIGELGGRELRGHAVFVTAAASGREAGGEGGGASVVHVRALARRRRGGRGPGRPDRCRRRRWRCW